MIDDTNQIANYQRHNTRDICKAVRELSDEKKQKLLESIQCRKGVCNLKNQDYSHENAKYIESLLNGKRPKNDLSKSH